jgi:hypothetical protein
LLHCAFGTVLATVRYAVGRRCWSTGVVGVLEGKRELAGERRSRHGYVDCIRQLRGTCWLSRFGQELLDVSRRGWPVLTLSVMYARLLSAVYGVMNSYDREV